MAAHFLLLAKSRPLTLYMVRGYDEFQSRIVFEELLWGVRGKQICPRCGTMNSHYKIPARDQYRCKEKGCGHTFSVTSASPFKNRKLSFQKLLWALVSFLLDANGKSALELSREMGVQYKTAFTLLHKLRDAIRRTNPDIKLCGLVQIDGGHFSGRPRKGRRKKRRDPAIPKKYLGRGHRAKYPSQSFVHHPNRRIVMVLRQLDPKTKKSVRTIVAVCKTENPVDTEALAIKWIAPGSTIHTDESKAFGSLKFRGFYHATVNHQVEFSTDDGVSDNQAEAFFSRMRRGVIGVYHRVAPRYMIDYAWETAWREDVRRKTTLQQLKMLVTRVFPAGPSPDWRGYWQGNKRPHELLFRAGTIEL